MKISNKAKKILITAGPVWVPIDSVRVITNIFTGTLGFLIAQEAARRGFKVTLLLGPGSVAIPKRISKNLEIIRFHFFDQLYQEMEKRVKSGNYKVLFHTAAVADYLPCKKYDGKIKSGQANLSISFKPTVKIIDMVKVWDPDILLIKFKLEAGLSKNELIAKAYESMLHSRAEIIVANDLSEMGGGGHKAYIVDRAKNIKVCNGKHNIAQNLIELIEK